MQELLTIRSVTKGCDKNEWYLISAEADHPWKMISVKIVVYCKTMPILGGTCTIQKDTVIGTKDKPLEKLEIGHGTIIYGGLICPQSFICGNYVTIHKEVFIYGSGSCVIGHNSWFGMRCTLDCEGEYWYCGNNFGAGQDTHMWGHIAHGDVLQGCKYYGFKSFHAEDDVWLVGRCTSAPARHEAFSVALVGSNITGNMEFNSVYGGNPAKDLTEKLGRPYQWPTSVEAQNKWDELIETNGCNSAHRIAEKFDLTTRTYDFDPKDSHQEKFFLWLLKKKKVKFLPRSNPRVELNL